MADRWDAIVIGGGHDPSGAETALEGISVETTGSGWQTMRAWLDRVSSVVHTMAGDLERATTKR